MKTKKIAGSLLLAGTLLVASASPALASLITQTELHFTGANADKVGRAISGNPERMFGSGSVSNRPVTNQRARTVGGVAASSAGEL